MTFVQVPCTHCGALLEVEHADPGQQIECPVCQGPLVITGDEPEVVDDQNAAPPEPPPLAASPPVQEAPVRDMPAANVSPPDANTPTTGASRPAPPAPETVAAPAEQPLRPPTLDEHAARRARRNVVMLALGLTVLVVTLGLLLYFVER